MTDPNTPDATPTEALPVAAQRPTETAVPAAPAATPAAPAARGGSHTRTILEVIGGVVAAGLIVVAGAVGFLVGHVAGSDQHDRWPMMESSDRGGVPFDGVMPFEGGSPFGRQAPDRPQAPDAPQP